MKKILYFILLLLAVVGFIGGIGYTIYFGVWFVAIGIAALGYMAFPKVKECFENLTE